MKVKGLCEWWFSGTPKEKNDRWFQSNPTKRKELDKYITVHFQRHLNGVLGLAKEKRFDILTMHSLKNVLLLDQVSRHVYRGSPELISLCTEYAVVIVLEHFKNSSHAGTTQAEELVFLLMPLKHSNPEKYFTFILTVLEQHYFREKPVLVRFYKDLVKKVSPQRNVVEFSKNKDYSEQNTLETFARITEFLPTTFWGICIDNTVYSTTLYKTVAQWIATIRESRQTQKVTVTISLSGGVDSTTLTYIFAAMRNVDENLRVQAYHYNARNRKESDDEQRFAEFYTQKLSVPLCVRVISEIQRDNQTDRVFYEDHTKTIRFDMYRKMCEIHPADVNVVALGHIADDVTENIWTNFARGINTFDLKKMHPLETIDGVNIFRPLLSTQKKDIVQFAKDFGIAFLLNTTPDWSNRGKFRNEFKPSILNQFGSTALVNTELVADTLKEMGDYFQSSVVDPFLERIERGNCHVKVTITDAVSKFGEHLGLHFWQTVLASVLHPKNVSLPSRSSIGNFIQKLQARFTGGITFNGDVFVYLEYDDEMGVLYIVFKKEYEQLGHQCPLKVSKWKTLRGTVCPPVPPPAPRI